MCTYDLYFVEVGWKRKEKVKSSIKYFSDSKVIFLKRYDSIDFYKNFIIDLL